MRFVKLPGDVLERRDLTASAKVVLAYLADRVGSNGRAWPGIRRIAADCGTSPNAVIRAIRQLEAVGLLAVTRPTGNPGRRLNEYRLRSGSAADSEALPIRHGSAADSEAPNVFDSAAQPDPAAEPITRPKKRARRASDPWAVAQVAMTNGVLSTDRFRQTWLAWVQYRREQRKPLTPSTIERQIRQLEASGHDVAIEIIEQSITHGWTGLFPPKSSAKGRAPEQLVESIVPREYTGTG